jgi:CYTH domain-containing protein
MADKVEKRYALTEWPFETDVLPNDGILCVQGFLALGNPEIRVRACADGTCDVVTKNGRQRYVRKEETFDISYSFAQNLFSACAGKIVGKTYFIRHGFHIDVFHAELAGLILAYPLPGFEDAPPPWGHEDVTDEPQYYDGFLAQYVTSLYPIRGSESVTDFWTNEIEQQFQYVDRSNIISKPSWEKLP